MAATTANLLTKSRNASKRRPIKVGNAEHIYAGTLVYLAADGYASAAPANGPFIGVACDEYDNSAGSDGDIEGEVWIDGAFEFTFAPGDAAQSDVGTITYGQNNAEVGTTTVDKQRVGTISNVISATRVEVEIDIQIPA